MKKTFTPIKAVLIALLVSNPLSLKAASATWTGATDGTWTGANWSPSVPGTSTIGNSADLATFNNATNTTITVDSIRSIGGLFFNPGAGAFTFNSGTLYLGPTTNGGSADDVVINSGVTNNQVINSAITPFRTSTAVNFGFANYSTAATLTFNGNITGNNASGATTTAMNVDGTGDIVINGVIANGLGALSLAKYGEGTLTLTNANTFTGSTTLADGKIVVDFSGASSPASNILPSGTTLVLGRGAPGGTAGSRAITFAGKSNTANSQTIGAVTLNVGAHHMNLTRSGTGTMTLNLPTISATRANGFTLDISAPTGTNVTTTTPNVSAGNLPNSITINGTDFARNDGSNNLVAFAAYTANTATTLGTSAQIVDMSGGNTAITGAGTTSLGGLRFNTAAATTITLDPARMLSLPATGILVTQNAGANLSKITGGLISGQSTRDFPIIQNNTLGDLQIDATITNASTNGALGLTKSGAGKLILGGQNSYSSNTYINEGTVAVTADPTVGNTQSLTTTASTTITGVNTTGLFIGQRVFGANINGNNAQGYYITGIDSGTNSITISGAATAGTANVTFGNSGGLGYYAPALTSSIVTSGSFGVQIGLGATLQIGNGGTGGGLVAGQNVGNMGTLAFNRSNDFSFTNKVFGTGSVVQAGTGKTALSVAQYYTGNTIVNDGTLEVTGESVVAQSSLGGSRTTGSAVITGMADTSNLRVGQPISGSGIAVGTLISSIDSGTQITMSANATSVNSTANIAVNGGSSIGTGTVTVNGGTLLVSSTGNINSTTGVSVTGGTFKYNGTTALDRNVTLNGGKFSYNSASNYTGTLTYTSGTIGGSNISNLDLSIGTGKTMSPGNSTGTMAAGATTWANGGTFLFELNDAAGTAGSTTAGWDLLNASSLNISAGTGQFTIQIASLDALQAAGLAQNFNGTSNYSWLFVDAGSAITGFDTSKFVFGDSFVNTTPGTFSISQGTGLDTDKLYINYTGVIPEPSTYAMLVGGLGLLAFLRRRSKA